MSGGAAGWALARGARGTWQRCRACWSDLPRRAVRAWLLWLAAGFALTAGVMAALTLLARERLQDALRAWDRRTLAWLIDHSFSFEVAVWWEALGSSAMLIPVVTTAGLIAIYSGRLILGATILVSYLLAKPIVLVGWNLWDRARPEVVAGGLAAPPLHSYPSGHALQTVAIYGLLAFLWMRASGSVLERALVILAWAALVTVVGVARLRMGTHWPSDVLAGAAVGMVWLAALILALRCGEGHGGR